MSQTLGSTIRGLYFAVLRPSRLVAVPRRRMDGSLWARLRESRKLVSVYLVNLVLYAGPLTLAGIGLGSASSIPGWLTPLVGDAPGTTLQLIVGFLRNSVYLIGVTAATLLGIHFALLVTFQSRGFFRTAYSVIYSTSVYLAGIFTVVWYLTTASGVSNAREFVVNLQVAFIYAIIDLTGSDFVFGVERPETVAASNFSTVGEYTLVALAVLFLYYLYSLYLGTRLNHDADRFKSLLVVLVVIALPALYVAGSIVFATLQ